MAQCLPTRAALTSEQRLCEVATGLQARRVVVQTHAAAARETLEAQQQRAVLHYANLLAELSTLEATKLAQVDQAIVDADAALVAAIYANAHSDASADAKPAGAKPEPTGTEPTGPTGAKFKDTPWWPPAVPSSIRVQGGLGLEHLSVMREVTPGDLVVSTPGERWDFKVGLALAYACHADDLGDVLEVVQAGLCVTARSPWAVLPDAVLRVEMSVHVPARAVHVRLYLADVDPLFDLCGTLCVCSVFFNGDRLKHNPMLLHGKKTLPSTFAQDVSTLCAFGGTLAEASAALVSAKFDLGRAAIHMLTHAPVRADP